MVAWPKEIAHAGRGENRKFPDKYDPRYGVDNKRRFLQDATLVLLQRYQGELTASALQNIVDEAEHINMLIVEKLK